MSQLGDSVRFGNFSSGRAEAAAIMQTFPDKYMLPPFMITTEAGTARRSWGNYMTNWGSTLGAVMFGMTGLSLADDLHADPTTFGAGRTAALPAGWVQVSFAAWLGGKRYTVVARHGEHAEITALALGGHAAAGSGS